MDQLQEDIINMIFMELWLMTSSNDITFKSLIAPFALISRSWQHAVEANLFKRIEVRNHELDQFEEIFVKQARRRMLRDLTFYNNDSNQHDGRGERYRRAARLQLFRTYVPQFLSILSGWEDSASDPLGLRYSLRLDCNHYDESSQAHTLIREPVDTSSRGSINHLMTFSDDHIDGRPIAAVWDLRVEGTLHPSVPCRLARLFPNLERWDFASAAASLSLPHKRAEFHTALAQGLTALCGKLPKLVSLRIMGYSSEPANQSFKNQVLVNKQGIDELSEAIRKLAQPTVRDLELTNSFQISPDLFRNRQIASNLDMWPALRSLRLRIDAVLPDGRWMFTGDPGEPEPLSSSSSHFDDEGVDSDDESLASDDSRGDGSKNGDRPRFLWRNVVDPTTFGVMARELTDAVQGGRMPRLRRAHIEVKCGIRSASVEYTEAGETRLSNWLDTVKARTWSLELEARGRGFDGMEGLREDWKEWVGDGGVVEVEVRDSWADSDEDSSDDLSES